MPPSTNISRFRAAAIGCFGELVGGGRRRQNHGQRLGVRGWRETGRWSGWGDVERFSPQCLVRAGVANWLGGHQRQASGAVPVYPRLSLCHSSPTPEKPAMLSSTANHGQAVQLAAYMKFTVSGQLSIAAALLVSEADSGDFVRPDGTPCARTPQFQPGLDIL